MNPRTWVTLFGKRILPKTKKRTSVEGLLSPWPRFSKALDWGFFKPLVEVFINPRSRYYNLDRGLINTSTEVPFSKKIIKRGRGGPNCHFQSLDRGTELDRGTANSTEEQRPSPQSNPSSSQCRSKEVTFFNLNGIKFFFFINL